MAPAASGLFVLVAAVGAVRRQASESQFNVLSAFADLIPGGPRLLPVHLSVAVLPPPAIPTVIPHHGAAAPPRWPTLDDGEAPYGLQDKEVEGLVAALPPAELPPALSHEVPRRHPGKQVEDVSAALPAALPQNAPRGHQDTEAADSSRAPPRVPMRASSTKVTARDRRGRSTIVRLPTAWASQLQTGSLVVVGISHTSTIMHARLADDPTRTVALTTWTTDRGFDAENEITVRKRLAASGNVDAYYGSYHTKFGSFMLSQACESDISALFDRYTVDRQSAQPGASLTPLDVLLPFAIDILRGARDLRKAKVAHGALRPQSVLLDGEGRPLISELSSATLYGRQGPRVVSNKRLITSLLGPPEDARADFPPPPSKVSGNVWGVGLVLAELVLGYAPTRELMRRWNARPSSWSDRLWRILKLRRITLKETIQERFNMQNDPRFVQLEDKDLQQLLSGLLQSNPKNRWTPVTALKFAEEMARVRDIPIPPERTPAQPPHKFVSEYW